MALGIAPFWLVERCRLTLSDWAVEANTCHAGISPYLNLCNGTYSVTLQPASILEELQETTVRHKFEIIYCNCCIVCPQRAPISLFFTPIPVCILVPVNIFQGIRTLFMLKKENRSHESPSGDHEYLMGNISVWPLAVKMYWTKCWTETTSSLWNKSLVRSIL